MKLEIWSFFVWLLELSFWLSTVMPLYGLEFFSFCHTWTSRLPQSTHAVEVKPTQTGKFLSKNALWWIFSLRTFASKNFSLIKNDCLTTDSPLAHVWFRICLIISVMQMKSHFWQVIRHSRQIVDCGLPNASRKTTEATTAATGFFYFHHRMITNYLIFQEHQEHRLQMDSLERPLHHQLEDLEVEVLPFGLSFRLSLSCSSLALESLATYIVKRL